MINRVTAVLAIKRVPKTVGHYMSSLSSLFNFFIAGKHIEASDQDELCQNSGTPSDAVTDDSSVEAVAEVHWSKDRRR